MSLLAPKERHSSADDKWSSLHTVVGSGQATQVLLIVFMCLHLLHQNFDATTAQRQDLAVVNYPTDKSKPFHGCQDIQPSSSQRQPSSAIAKAQGLSS